MRYFFSNEGLGNDTCRMTARSKNRIRYRTHESDPRPTVDQAHLALCECASQFLSDRAGPLVPGAHMRSGKDADALHARTTVLVAV